MTQEDFPALSHFVGAQWERVLTFLQTCKILHHLFMVKALQRLFFWTTSNYKISAEILKDWKHLYDSGVISMMMMIKIIIIVLIIKWM
jgi:hypothetical protein